VCRIIIFLICLLTDFFPVSWASTAHSSLVSAISQQLWAEQTRNTILLKKLQNLRYQQQNSARFPHAYSDILKHLPLIIAMTQADLNNISLSLETVNQSVALAEDAVRFAQDRWDLSKVNDLSEQKKNSQLVQQRSIQEQQAVLALQKQRYAILGQSRVIAQQILSLAQTWSQQLQVQVQTQQRLERQEEFDQLARDLQVQQRIWLERLMRWSQKLQTTSTTRLSSVTDYTQIELAVFEAEEQINFTQVALNLARLDNKFDDLRDGFNQNLSLSTLSNLKHQIESLTAQCQDADNLLDAKLQFLHNYIKLAQHTNTSVQQSTQDLQQLLRQYQKLSDKTKQLYAEATRYQHTVSKQLQSQLANRQGLPGFNWQAWLILVKPIVQIPRLLIEKFLAVYQLARSELTGTTVGKSFLGLFFVILWLGCGFKLKRFLVQDAVNIATDNRGFFSTQTMLIVVQLLRRHLMPIFITLMTCGVFLWIGVAWKGFAWIVILMIVGILFSIVIQLACIVLMENTTDESGHDVTLYYRLRATLLVGAIITFSSILVNQLPVNYEVQDLFGRLFMLFLFVVAVVLMRGWEVVPTLLSPYLEKRHAYLQRVVRWLSFLIPVSLLSNALLGLVGYVELAWAIADYQGLFLLALAVYLLMRGLLDELIRWLSEQCIRRLRNGWLWSQALLKPMHQLLKLILLLACIMFLITLYGKWDSSAVISNNIDKLFNLKLFMITNVTITVLTVIELLIAITILVWLSHWSREFAYRWFFAHVQDLGLRNSLAIFTQYAMVALGVLITLNLVGLTINMIVVILSGFALGLAFGLRDLFNNFVVGIFLLLERPVKVGDWVTIGSYDGQVAHIGARSITVTTDDHQDLLVPNADIFSKNFINWTHRDSVIRAVVPVRVHRHDSPKRIKELILEVLANTPKILTNPKPEVYFIEIDKMLLDFKVTYYIDLNHVSSRTEVRSQFLFALWDRFAQETILAPYDVQEVRVEGHLNLSEGGRSV